MFIQACDLTYKKLQWFMPAEEVKLRDRPLLWRFRIFCCYNSSLEQIKGKNLFYKKTPILQSSLILQDKQRMFHPVIPPSQL